MRALFAIALLLGLSAEARTKFRPKLGGARMGKVAAASSSAPPPIFTLMASDPGTECSGDGLTSGEGTAVTVTNASTARYCTRVGDGRLANIVANAPRVNNRGLLVESGRTNLVTRSRELNLWTVSNVTAPSANTDEDPEGGGTAELVATSAAGGYITNPSNMVPSQTTTTISFYARTNSGTQAFAVVFHDVTATADRTTSCNITTATTTYQRIVCNASGLTGANAHKVRIFPGGLAGEGSIVVWGVQVEAPSVSGSVAFATSLVHTAGGTITRSADAVTWSNTTDISAQGCLSARVTFGTVVTGAVLANGTEKMLGAGSSTTITANDGTNTVTATVSDITGRTIDVLAKWSGSSMTVIADGVQATGSFDGSFSSTATMRIGATAAGSGFCNCEIENIKVGSDPESCS